MILAAPIRLLKRYTQVVTGNGTYNAGSIISSPGIYYWIVSYSGDLTHRPFTTTCGDEVTIVTMVTPGAACCANIFGTLETQALGVTNNLTVNGNNTAGPNVAYINIDNSNGTLIVTGTLTQPTPTQMQTDFGNGGAIIFSYATAACIPINSIVVTGTFTSGIYCIMQNATITNVTLDAQGNPEAVFIFGGLPPSFSISVVDPIDFINGALPCNTYMGSSQTNLTGNLEGKFPGEQVIVNEGSVINGAVYSDFPILYDATINGTFAPC